MFLGYTETSARPVYGLSVARGLFTFGLLEVEEVRDFFRRVCTGIAQSV